MQMTLWITADGRQEATGEGAYQMTFTFYDKSVGSGVQYVWRVDINARSISPLSYHAT